MNENEKKGLCAVVLMMESFICLENDLPNILCINGAQIRFFFPLLLSVVEMIL